MTIDLDDPSEVVVAAAAAFANAGIDVAVYGGLALAMYGEPRETKDADLAVTGVSAAAGQAALVAANLTTVIAFEGITFGGLSITRLTIVGGGKLNMVDLVTPRSPRYAAALMRRVLRGTLDGHPLGVVAPEDFILLKVLSTRERDLEDARTVIEALKGRLDNSVLRYEIDLLAAEIIDHDVRGRFSSVMHS